MTALQREVIHAMLETNGNAADAARMMNRTRNAVCYHLDCIKKETGLDPRCFKDLLKLADKANLMDELADVVERCRCCGDRLNRQNVSHTRIVTCDGYGNAECEDFALCIPCSAKVIEYAKRKGGGE